MTQRELMWAGEPYRADDPELTALRDHAFRVAKAFNDGPPEDRPVLDTPLAGLLGGAGEGTVIRPPFRCDYGAFTTFGARTFVNFDLVVLDGAAVRVGDDVQMAPRVQLLTATHPLDVAERISGVEQCLPVTIEDGVWLGAGVIVCPGVTVGAGTTVAAGAVVAHDLPPRVLAAGVPARVVREL